MREVVGFEGLYKVDEVGNVYSENKVVNHNFGGLAVKRGKRLKPELTNAGYLRVLLIGADGKRYHKCVHRLVAEAYIKNTLNLPQVNHKNGNKLDNSVDNLEWCTSQMNNIHALKTGLRTGEKRGKQITVKGITFKSITDAANHFKTSRYIIKKMKSNDYPVREYICGETPQVEAHQ